MESLLTKLYSRCKVGDAEAATSSSPRETETAVVHATRRGHQQKPAGAIQRSEGASHPCSEIPPTRSLDVATDHDSGDSARLYASAFQPRSLAQTTASNSPPDNAADLQCRGSQSELESDDTVTANQGPLVDQPVGSDISLSHKEIESFELLDVSDFENDNSSESFPPSPLQPVPQPCLPRLSDSTVSEATRSSGLLFNQSKLGYHHSCDVLKKFFMQ